VTSDRPEGEEMTFRLRWIPPVVVVPKRTLVKPRCGGVLQHVRPSFEQLEISIVLEVQHSACTVYEKEVRRSQAFDRFAYLLTVYVADQAVRPFIKGQNLLRARGVDQHLCMCGNDEPAVAFRSDTAQHIVNLLLKYDMQVRIGFVEQQHCGWSSEEYLFTV